ncbi:MAG: glycerol-3-phosphate 1-O-acyltransferase PlsY [Ruminococcaceae bacterium]|nr:glycerol-3-phosphate 1-O-acyltransferase PlsY [Oscillospiraceae bacterium]
MRYLFQLDPEHKVLGFIYGIATDMSVPARNALIITAWVLCAVIAYLLGSLNSAIIVSRYKYKQDIRSFGSGNAGLTNMHRVYGKDGAVYTLIGDIAKQLVSVIVGSLLLGRSGAYLAGAFCMIGHIFPVYYRFKGGKGVLTAATMILIIDPMIFAVLFVIFALVLIFTKYVSLSSIIAAISYPAVIRIAYGMEHPFELFFALFTGCVVIFMHRTNIFRLFNNQESKFSFRKKPETQEILDMEDKENDSDNTYYPPATKKNKKKK